MPENVSYFVQYMCKICASPHNSLYLEGCKKENIPIFKFRYLGKHQRKSDIYPPSCGFRDIGLLFLLSRKIYLGLVIKHSNEKRSDERKIKKMLLICFSFIFYSLLNVNFPLVCFCTNYTHFVFLNAWDPLSTFFQRK